MDTNIDKSSVSGLQLRGRKLYTVGYRGHTPSDLLFVVRKLDAILVDVRYMPFTKNPIWHQSNLKKVFGSSYLWVRSLGNENYKGDKGNGIRIANINEGARVLAQLEKPAILMCACSDFESCHRKLLTIALRQVGSIVEEIDWESGEQVPPIQGSLF